MTISKQHKNLDIIILMTLGVSLSQWHKTGQAARESNIYKRQCSKGHRVSILSYGKDDLEHSSYWSPIAILPWVGRIDHFIKYAAVAPLYHWSAFRRANIVKSNQSPGSLVGLVAKLVKPSIRVDSSLWLGPNQERASRRRKNRLAAKTGSASRMVSVQNK